MYSRNYIIFECREKNSAKHMHISVVAVVGVECHFPVQILRHANGARDCRYNRTGVVVIQAQVTTNPAPPLAEDPPLRGRAACIMKAPEPSLGGSWNEHRRYAALKPALCSVYTPHNILMYVKW